jgi:hypothetical protein
LARRQHVGGLRDHFALVNREHDNEPALDAGVRGRRPDGSLSFPLNFY